MFILKQHVTLDRCQEAHSGCRLKSLVQLLQSCSLPGDSSSSAGEAVMFLDPLGKNRFVLSQTMTVLKLPPLRYLTLFWTLSKTFIIMRRRYSAFA